MKAEAAVFSILFLLITAVPPILTDFGGAVSETENRNLAEAPRLVNKGNFNFNFFKDTDAFLNDRFGLKDKFAALNSSLEYRVFHKQGNKRALRGKDGWLFYIDRNDGDNPLDFQKLNLFDDAALDLFYDQIRRRAQWCEDRGIQFLFLIAPSKHTIYSEYYPFNRPDGITRLDQIVQNMPDDLQEYIIIPKEHLLQKKNDPAKPLYFETDTHWNMLAAFYAFDLLGSRIRAALPGVPFPEIPYTEKVEILPGDGDIVPMLGLRVYETNTKITIEPEKGWDAYYGYTVEAVKNGDLIVTEGTDTRLPKAIIYRDSFSMALQPFISTFFFHAEFIWKWPDNNDKNHIQSEKPDMVIWEIVERYVGNIPGSPLWL
jgi:hypothetical protein